MFLSCQAFLKSNAFKQIKVFFGGLGKREESCKHDGFMLVYVQHNGPLIMRHKEGYYELGGRVVKSMEFLKKVF